MYKRLAWITLAVYLLLITVSWAQPVIPAAPVSSIYIQDQAGVLSPETKKNINALGTKVAAKTKAQIVVLTIPSLDGVPIEDYSLSVLRKWGIGDKQLNNGVLMLIAVNDKQSRIEVGYGLEGALPDAKTGALQDEYMIPYFAKGDYNGGVWNGYLSITSVVAKEYNVEIGADTKPARAVQHQAQISVWDTLPWWVQLLLVVGLVLLLIFDWIFLGGAITYFLLSILRFRGGGGGGGGGFGGGSGGGGGSSRKW